MRNFFVLVSICVLFDAALAQTAAAQPAVPSPPSALPGMPAPAAPGQDPALGAPAVPAPPPPQAAEPGPGAAAQPAAPGQPSAAPEAAAQAPEAKPAPPGDKVTLKSGVVLDKVQVLRRTASDLEVAVTDEVTLSIPRKQVLKVEYDNYEPALEPRKTEPESKEQSSIPGAKVNPEVYNKLNAPLPEPCLKDEGRDLVAILQDISRRVGVVIEVAESVQAVPEAERRWSYQVEQGTSLMGLLQDRLLKDFPNLGVEYQFNKVSVLTKTPAPPAPAPAPAAPGE